MIYFFDGSKDAFLTAFLLAFRDEDALFTTGNHQLTLGQKSVFVRADTEKARRCAARLTELDARCMHDLSLLLRSGEPERGQIAFCYFRLIASRQRPVHGELAEEAVLRAKECIRRVTFEAHRLKGFVRFLECASGTLYAPIFPDHDICDLLLPHFRSRLPEIPFAIHDIRRNKAAVWDGSHTFVAPLEKAEIVLSVNETGWQDLWRQYYTNVNIPSRKRLRQMKSYMPVRYWKFMPENPSAAIGDLIRETNAALSGSPDAAPRLHGSVR